MIAQLSVYLTWVARTIDDNGDFLPMDMHGVLNRHVALAKHVVCCKIIGVDIEFRVWWEAFIFNALVLMSFDPVHSEFQSE